MSTTTTTRINAEQVPASELAVGNFVAATRKAILAGKGREVATIEQHPSTVRLLTESGQTIARPKHATKLWRLAELAEPTELEEQATPLEADEDAGKSGKTNNRKGKKMTETTAKPASFEWPQDPAELLVEYVTEQVSTERNAPNEGLPFITSGGVLRIRGEHWIAWLNARGIAAPKLEASRPIRELGFAMKPYPLPGEDRSHGFYTGPAPKSMSKLPRRELERAAGRPRKPFGKLSAEQAEVLGRALEVLDIAADEPELAAAQAELIAELEARDAAAGEK